MVFGSNEEHKSGRLKPVCMPLHAGDEDGGGAGGHNRAKGEAKEKHFLDAIRVSVAAIEPEVNHFHFSNFQLYNLIAFLKKIYSGNLSNSVPIAG